MLFAMNHSQALKEEGTISGEGNAGEEVYEKLLDTYPLVKTIDREDAAKGADVLVFKTRELEQ